MARRGGAATAAGARRSVTVRADSCCEARPWRTRTLPAAQAGHLQPGSCRGEARGANTVQASGKASHAHKSRVVDSASRWPRAATAASAVSGLGHAGVSTTTARSCSSSRRRTLPAPRARFAMLALEHRRRGWALGHATAQSVRGSCARAVAIRGAAVRMPPAVCHLLQQTTCALSCGDAAFGMSHHDPVSGVPAGVHC